MFDSRIIIAIASIIVIIALIFYFKDIQTKNPKISKNVSLTLPSKSENFNNNILILLCYANWCTHCQTLKPVFEKLVETQPVPDVDFDMVEESDKSKYVLVSKEINSYPTLVIDNGKTISTFVGMNKILEVLQRLGIK